jgi:hypothetical protein
MSEIHLAEPSDCPEYIRCNAPICPLDVDWRKRVFDSGDSTCLWLREAMKAGAEQRLSANETWHELHRISKEWIEQERTEAGKRQAHTMPRGRGGHLSAVLAAAHTGSTLDKRAASGERLAANKAAKDQASSTPHTSAS